MFKDIRFLPVFIPLFSFAQSDYTIVYSHDYAVNIRLGQGISYLTREETLFINGDTISYYYFFRKKKNETGKTIGSKYIHHSFYTHHGKKLRYHVSALKNKFIYYDSIKVFPWKLLPDTMNISGYKCFKAVADSVIAWYCPEIPVRTGPGIYNGLPGLIIQLKERDKLIKMKKLTREAPVIVFPEKAMIISYEEYIKRRDKLLPNL